MVLILNEKKRSDGHEARTSSSGTAFPSVRIRSSVTRRESLREWLKKYGEAAAALISGVLMAAAWGLESVSGLWSVVLYSLAFILGGFVKAREGLHTLIRERDLDVNLLMIVAAVSAAAIGYWAEGAC